jgi:hypothetical protein
MLQASDLLDLSGFFLDFPGDILVLTIRLEIGIIADFANILFDRALHFVHLTFDLVFVLSFIMVLLGALVLAFLWPRLNRSTDR